MDKKYERGGSMFSQVHPISNEGHNETFTGYSLSKSRIGAATSPFTQMQITEVESRLREGMRVVEAGTLAIKEFDSIPIEHFKDMRRLAKLANAEITMHAPLINPAGFQEGHWGGEEAREKAEMQFRSVIMKSLEANPQGNIPIVIHAAGVEAQSATWEKGPKGEFQQKVMFVVNQMDGSISPIKKETSYNPRTGEQINVETPSEILEDKNIKNWRELLNQVQESMAKRDEVAMEGRWGEELRKEIKIDEKAGKKRQLTYEEQRILGNINENIRRKQIYDGLLEEHVDAITKIATKFSGDEGKLIGEIIHRARLDFKDNPDGAAIGALVDLERMNVRPTSLRSVDEFSREHVSETFSNLAVWAKNYADKKGYKAPTIVAENFFPETAFSTADSMIKLMKESRKKTEEKLMAQGLSEDAAKREAKKLIGVTWDVGHINNFKKYGFEDEDIIKETNKIAKYVKHLHMHDNMGTEPSHLPVGTGNVPLGGILKALEAEGYDGRAILEGGAIAPFKTSDFSQSMQYLDTPIYGAGASGPGWGSVPQGQSYFSGYGNILPEQHFSMYGGGFSQLPTELGGRAGSRGGRFSGTPTE